MRKAFIILFVLAVAKLSIFHISPSFAREIDYSLHNELYYCTYNIHSYKGSCENVDSEGILNGSWRSLNTVEEIIEKHGFGNDLLYSYSQLTSGEASEEKFCSYNAATPNSQRIHADVCSILKMDKDSSITRISEKISTTNDFISIYLIVFEALDAKEVDRAFNGLLSKSYEKVAGEINKSNDETGDVYQSVAKDFLCRIHMNVCREKYIGLLSSFPSFRMAVIFQEISHTMHVVSLNREQKIWVPVHIEALTHVGKFIAMSLNYNHQRNLILSGKIMPDIREAIIGRQNHRNTEER